MALDEALLDLVAGGDSMTAYLRTYGWAVPTLSLGYFQKLASAREDPRWADVPMVRRLTGGGAIWHHHELTYALALPVTHPMARPTAMLYRQVHRAIGEILEELGASVTRRGVSAGPPLDRGKRPLLCFTDSDPEDIVSNGVKIVGSAQRRRSGAILQHGSVLFRHSHFAPELTGLCDLAMLETNARECSDRLLSRIPQVLELESMACGVPDEVRRRAALLEQTVYRHPDWMGLR